MKFRASTENPLKWVESLIELALWLSGLLPGDWLYSPTILLTVYNG